MRRFLVCARICSLASILLGAVHAPLLNADPVTGVTLSHPLVVIQEGQLGTQVVATVAPASATNTALTWSSADTSVATVDENGWVHPVAAGETTITATTDEGDFEASTPVQVRSGWTQFTLAPGRSIYYVSSSGGNNSNDGLSPETPLATVFEGLSRIGGGDWLLLKRGDTFNEGIHYWQNGESKDYKTVIGAYGDEALPRPILDPKGDYGMMLHGGGIGAPRTRPDQIKHVAFVSLHFFQSNHQPSAPGFQPSGGNFAISLLRTGEDVLFEDIRWDWFRNARIQGDGGGLKDLTIRRCAFMNNFGGRSQGIFMNWCDGVLIEENVFDSNGFNEEAGVLPTIFNHNMYLQYDSSPVMMVRRNITARGSATGLQQRPGGVAEQNVFIENPIAGFVAGGSVSPEDGVQILNDNIVIDAATWAVYDESTPPVRQGTRGWGLMLNHGDGDLLPKIAEMRGNIVANGPGLAIRPYEVVGPLQSIATVSHNITYNWGNSQNSPGPFPDPSRTTGSYNASLGGGATNDAFITAAAAQRRGDWSSDYTWEGIWNYIREGFGVSTVYWRNVTDIALNETEVEIPVYNSVLLEATVTPWYASQTLVGWISSNPEVAEVTPGGRVLALSPGVATITAVSTDGGHTASAEVTVVQGAPLFSSIIGATLVDEEKGLFESEWLGFFYENPTWNNWIYHTGFGWLNAALVTDAASPWFWSVALETWIFASADTYPWCWMVRNINGNIVWVRRFGDQWIYYATAGDGSGWVYHLGQDQWYEIDR